MKSIDPASFDYGFGLDFYVLGDHSYYGHSGEVANSSSMFYSELNSDLAPQGYYVSYNFNIQGANMPELIDIPVYDLLNQNLSMITGIKKDPKVNVYPNPADTKLTLQTHQNNIRYILTDAFGQKVMSSELSSFEESIDEKLLIYRGQLGMESDQVSINIIKSELALVELVELSQMYHGIWKH